MAENKTQPTSENVDAFLAGVTPPRRRAQGEALKAIFDDVTGWQACMWGPSIVGYGRYDYTYDSGRTGSFLATGFSPRKAALSIYIMPAYAEFGEILGRLGKHRIGKSCLYVNKLADIDMDVLAELVRAGLRDLERYWPVEPT